MTSIEAALFLAALAAAPLPVRATAGGGVTVDRGLIAADALAAGVPRALAHDWAAAAERGVRRALADREGEGARDA